MKRTFLLIIAICVGFNLLAQKPNLSKGRLLSETSANACKCIDSISVYNKSKEDVAKEVHRCIDQQTSSYLLMSQMMGIISDSVDKAVTNKDGKKQININLNLNPDSREYKAAYYEIERFLMDSCVALKSRIAANDKISDKSVSDNPVAYEFYKRGQDAMGAEDYKEAVKQFEKAVKKDPTFAFAWDNLGLSYRKLGDYDKALEAYNKSIEVDPTGTMPLQNIAIVYQYKKDFPKAIEAYEKLASIKKDDPEVFYGIGQIYATRMAEYEKGLDYMCKAYNLYVAQKSAYRTDAEKVIQFIYSEMKKQNKQDKFNEILKANNISPN